MSTAARLQSLTCKPAATRCAIASLGLGVLALLAGHAVTAAETTVMQPATPADWYRQGEQLVDSNAAIARQAKGDAKQRAKNVVLMIGDGMGISTVTAARIFAGQQAGRSGEENRLFFETFPHLALSKTYNTNQQTPDSAGTATALMSGVKTKAGLIGVNQNVVRGDCSTVAGNELLSALMLAELAGKSTGVVSTARITHATPAAAYAHAMDRDFESDADGTRLANAGHCEDIASQLLSLPQRLQALAGGQARVDGLEVALGGGRAGFLPRSAIDAESGKPGKRADGRDLTREWQDNYPNAAYVWNQQQFDALDVAQVDHLLGLFQPSHMQFEMDRGNDKAGEPSLSEMSLTALRLLQKNPRGFFLQVESGRIDHAHHATNPIRALSDAAEFANAVRTVYENTDPSETLIIVTADHSHVFTLAGYPTRGNPILGKVVGNDRAGEPEHEHSLAEDGRPYTTVGYMNGRGFATDVSGEGIYARPVQAGRVDLSKVDTEAEGFHPETLVPTSAETHGAEDVAIYATGPGAPLINGVMEQHAVFHVMNRAARLRGGAGIRGE
ncbi:alkaline phosphatase [Pseudomaricurvus sp. HS19]|uniref:alkaline phosphatase n=1 Tax=Pseudomaricurvus sp. HS19 TaxID=2692626 RepID=UPI0019291B4D|nr:alkaline phosphatase [Pseudomaricurvus sp. HS19]